MGNLAQKMKDISRRLNLGANCRHNVFNGEESPWKKDISMKGALNYGSSQQLWQRIPFLHNI